MKVFNDEPVSIIVDNAENLREDDVWRLPLLPPAPLLGLPERVVFTLVVVVK